MRQSPAQERQRLSDAAASRFVGYQLLFRGVRDQFGNSGRLTPSRIDSVFVIGDLVLESLVWSQVAWQSVVGVSKVGEEGKSVEVSSHPPHPTCSYSIPRSHRPSAIVIIIAIAIALAIAIAILMTFLAEP